jgi:ribonuclease HI
MGNEKPHIDRYNYECTNNEMEYAAVLWALNIAEDGDIVYTDSQLVVNQVMGKWKVKEQRLAGFCVLAKEKLQSKQVILVWIPREENLAGKVLEK